MKMQAGCAALAAMIFVSLLSGCQSGARANKTPEIERLGRVDEPVDKAEAKEPQLRTVRVRDPRTGETMTKQVPVNSPGKNPPKTRTVRTRDPGTGRTITRQVPVTTAGSKPAAPGEFELNWTEKCTVRQAFDAIQTLFYETLELTRVPVAQGGSTAIDKISAKVRGRSANNVIFSVYAVYDTPDASIMTLRADGKTQRSDILKKQTLFVRSKISEAIAKKPEVVNVAAKPLPYPKTLILDHSIDHVYSVVYGWQKNEKFRQDNRGYTSGKYYKRLGCSTGSGIDFSFSLGMIDVSKTKLVIDIKDFEGKDEFPMILKSLKAALKALGKPAGAGEGAAVQKKPRARRKEPTLAEQKASLESKIAGIQEIMSRDTGGDPEQKKKENEAWRKLLEALQAEEKAIEAKKNVTESSKEKPAIETEPKS